MSKRLKQAKTQESAAYHLQRIAELSAAARHTAPRPRSSSLISERQREVVVKYINELAEDFELCVQTGTLACNYFDRYAAMLSASGHMHTADKRFIQMIASTCLLIAAKFSDRKLPPLSELVKVHHGKVLADEFAALELRILQALRWKLHVPLPHAFVDPLCSLCLDAPFNTAIEDRMLFFIDLSIYGYHFLAYSHAAIAASAIVVAWKFSGELDAVKAYTDKLAFAVNLAPAELMGCVGAMVDYYQTCFPEAASHADASSTNIFAPIDPHDSAISPSSIPAEPEITSNAPSPRPLSSPSLPPAADGPAGPAAAKQQKAEHERRTPDSVLEIGMLV